MQFLCDAIVLVFGFFFGVPTCTTHCDAVTRDLFDISQRADLLHFL